MDNDGRVISRIVTHENAAAGVRDLVTAAPAAWLKRAGRAKRLVIYAHGGLNDEHGSIERIRVLAPYFAANDIYPLFLTWRTGAIETLSDIVDDELKRVPRPDAGVGDLFDRVKETVVEALDRTIEVATRPVVKPIWGADETERRGVHRGWPRRRADRGRVATAQNEPCPTSRSTWSGTRPVRSCWAICSTCSRRRRIGVASCSLYAPACTVEFALAHYVPAVEAKVLPKSALHIHLLSNRRELDDTVGPYQKSLLYLVSRALESDHKTPILGLANVFDPSVNDDWHDRVSPPALPRWQAFWGAANPNLHVVDTPQVSTGARGTTDQGDARCVRQRRRDDRSDARADSRDDAAISGRIARLLKFCWRRAAAPSIARSFRTTARCPVESLHYWGAAGIARWNTAS